ncbi:Sat4 [Kluyveromyces lactis]|nr:Sat4 [Kluyveromyces lactis]
MSIDTLPSQLPAVPAPAAAATTSIPRNTSNPVDGLPLVGHLQQQEQQQQASVLRTRSRKGTFSSKIGKLFGVSKVSPDEDLPRRNVSVNTSTSQVPQATSAGSGTGTAASPPSPPSSSSSSSLSSRYRYDGPRPSSPRLASGATSTINSSSYNNKHFNSQQHLASDGKSIASSTEKLHSASSTANLSTLSSASTCPNPNRRFILHEDGTHEHHLKNAKRQEKLGSMIKNMLGAQKLRGEAKSAVPDILIKSMKSGDPPSLFAGLIKQVDAASAETYQLQNGTAYPYSGATQVLGPKQEQSQPDLKMLNFEDAVNPLHHGSVTFGQKYGRCQEVIGKGSFGVVRICHKKNLKSVSGEILYAVKEFRRRPTENPVKYSKRLTSEFCISSSLKHTNIIETLDLFQDAKGDYCEVMEYCSGGDLFTLIIAAGKLEYQEADCFLKQLITGVVYMHNMGVCHRDLKPENLLLTHDGTLKITDFGNSECFRMAWEKEIHLSGGVCGSGPYIAPEEYTQEEFDPRAVDIWACGVIYMAMRTGRQLWATAQKEDEFYLKYLKGRKNAAGYDPIEKLKRARCRNVIYSILDPVPSRRLSGDQILNSEWGREIVCCHEGHPIK